MPVQAPETYKHFREATIEGLARVREQLSAGKDIQRYSAFPAMSYWESGLPGFYYSSGNQTPIDYKACFRDESAPETIPSWKAFAVHAADIAPLRSPFDDLLGVDSSGGVFNTAGRVFSTLEHFIDRYIHIFQTTDINEEAFLELYQLWENSVLSEELPFDILVPIIYLTCDFDPIDLGDIAIEKMTDEVQLARSNKHFRAVVSVGMSGYTIAARDWIEGAATHALVLKNWSIRNPGCWRRRDLLTSADTFTEPLKKIDLFIAALRAVTSHETGYSQLVIRPRDWADPDHWEASLPDLYVVSLRGAYPDHFEEDFEDYGLRHAKPPELTEHDCREAAKIFHKIEESPNNKLILAARRLNSACLRGNEQDAILDVTIGLETLLVDDTWNQTGDWLGRRLAALCRLRPFESHSLSEVFDFCKKVYAFRSAVVHGAPVTKKNRVVKLSRQQSIPTLTLGIRLVRHVVVILAEHPEYLDVKRIDRDLLDE